MSNALLASKIAIIEESPTNPAIAGATLSDCAMNAICQRGPIGGSTGTLVTSFAQYSKVFGDFTANADGPLAAQMFFDNGGQNLWVNRTVHYTDPTNAASFTATNASVVLDTASLTAQPAVDKSTLVGPYALAAGQTLLLSVNGGGAVTTTFAATTAHVTGSNTATFDLTNNDTFVFSIDGEPEITVTFLTAQFVSIAAATITEVLAVINAAIGAVAGPAVATNSASAVLLTTTTKGSGSTIQIYAGSNGSDANTQLGFTVGTSSGTGNVANIGAVTATEVEAAVVAAVGAGITGAVVGGVPVLTTAATGPAATLQCTSGTARAAIGFTTTLYSGTEGGALPTLVVSGKTPCAEGNTLQPQIAAATSGSSTYFNLNLFEGGALVEVWPNITMVATDPRYAPTIINDANNGSDYISVTDELCGAASPNNNPTTGTFSMAGGSDGLVGLADADFTGNQAGPTGLHCFDKNQALRILITPGQATPAVHNGMLTYCEAFRFGSMFAILDPPMGYTAAEIDAYVVTTAGLKNSSEFGAIYWPNVQIANPNTTIFGTAAAITVPPSGAIAGRYGANDAAIPGGIYEAPAGIGEAPTSVGWGQLVNVLGLETNEVQDETKRDLIYPDLINPIVGLEGLPIHMDGCKTLLSTGNFPTIGERRGVIYIEQSFETGLAPFKHRKIKSSTLAALGRSGKSFLKIQTSNGAFASDDPTQAFKVDTGAGINAPADSQALTMNMRVGLATAKPGEFIVLRVGQDTSLLQTQLAQAAAA